MSLFCTFEKKIYFEQKFMKKLFAIVMLGVLCSCQPKTVQKDGGIIMEVELGDNLSSSSDVAKTIEILKKRVETISTGKPVFSVDGRNIHIEMPFVSDTLTCTTFLIQKGEFEISRTYANQTVLQYFSAINKNLVENKNYDLPFPNDTTIMKENPLFNLISIQKSDIDRSIEKGPAVGYVSPKDTALINAVFRNRQLSLLIPRDLIFMWARERKSINGEVFILIAVKKQHSEKLITNDMIEDAKTNDNNAFHEIDIVFKPEFHSLWKRITNENIGLSLALIVDNEVISYPTVQSEISNGRSSISSNFTITEAKALAALLKNGVLPLTVKVKKITLVNGK